MTPETLHRLLQSLAETERAFQKASSAGATHVQAVSNALVTLSDATLHTSRSDPAISELGTAHTVGTVALCWLRTCVKRLGVAVGGAERAAAEITAADPRWGRMVQPILSALRDDLAEKQRVLAQLVRCVAGASVRRAPLQRDVAAWLEGVVADREHAQEVLAAHVAEVEAGQLEIDESPASSGRQNPKRRGESPAVAFLLKTTEASR